MTKELQDKLYADFPDLFSEKDLPMSETCMCWGLECGDGWEPIIRQMCVQLKGARTYFMRLKSPLFRSYQMYTWLEVKTEKLRRWTERKLGLHPYSLRIPNPFKYVSFIGWGVRFTQIKEKFGTLRAYYTIYPKVEEEEMRKFDQKQLAAAYERYSGYVEGVTSFTEYLSSKTCEHDGNPGRLTGRRWLATRCTNCQPEEENV
jgi:hypothetical protein